MATEVKREGIGNLAAAAFASSEQADEALRQLKDSGFSDDQIRVARSKEEEPLLQEWMPSAEESSGRASVTHSIIGGVIGTLVGIGIVLVLPDYSWLVYAFLIAALAATGIFGVGLIGPLLQLEVEGDRVVYLDERLRAGDTIVTVRDAQRSEYAQEILNEYGGKSPGNPTR